MSDKMNTGSGKGGRREGAGRKPLPEEDRLIQTTIRVTQSDLEELRQLGEGNLSEGVRLATAIAVKSIKRRKPVAV